MNNTATLEPPKPTTRRGEMSVLDQSGDFKIIWDADKPDEVEQARKTFEDLRKKGYAPFKVNRQGNQGEQVRTFDPEQQTLIMVPAMQGG